MIDNNSGYKPISDRENYLAKVVVDIAFVIHKALGPGLLESVYEKCFCHELELMKIPFVCQKKVAINYRGLELEDGLRLDLLVDDLLIVELKAQVEYHPIWDAQLLSYLKLTGKRIGYLINFHVPLMKDGFKRMVL